MTEGASIERCQQYILRGLKSIFESRFVRTDHKSGKYAKCDGKGS